jgi:uncharacterized membrane protein YhaH (DUF805 family)
VNDTDHDTSPLSDASRPAPGQTDTTHPLDPKGRFTRLSWLAWTLVLGVASGLLLFGLVALGLVTLPEPDPQTGPPLAMGVGILVLQVIFLVLYLLLAIRRFHDINASGWWSALLILPLVNLVAWLVLAIKRGDDAANRFGPPRPTPTWERVLGIISIVLIVLGLIGTIAAIAIPAYLD